MKNINLSDLGISDLGKSAEKGKPLLIPLEMIDEDPQNPRSEKNKGFSKQSLEALAETIKQKGVFDPICVKEAENGRYIINFGARRFRASKLAGKTEIPAFINNEFDDFSKGLENIQRHGLTPYEIADLLKKERDKGKTQDEIAKENGISKGWVNQHLRLLNLPICLEKAWDQEKISDVAATSELLSLIKKYGEDEIAIWLYRQEEVSRSKIREFKKVLELELEAKKEVASVDVDENSINDCLSANELDLQENDGGGGENKVEDFSLKAPPKEIFTPSLSSEGRSEHSVSQVFEETSENQNQEDFPFEDEDPLPKLSSAPGKKFESSNEISHSEGDDDDFKNSTSFVAPVSPSEEISDDETKVIHNPKLIVEFYGKRALLLLHKKPSSEDKVWIKYHADSVEAEVLSEQLKIKGLMEG